MQMFIIGKPAALINVAPQSLELFITELRSPELCETAHEKCGPS
jgi:hypothetical protein